MSASSPALSLDNLISYDHTKLIDVLKALMNRADAQEQELKKLKTAASDKNIAIAHLQNQINDNQKTVHKQGNELKQLKQNFHSTITKTAAIDSAQQKLEERVQALETDVTRLHTKSQATAEIVSSNTGGIGTNQDGLKDHNSELKDLNVRLDRLDIRLSTSNNSSSNNIDRSNTDEEALLALRAAVSGLTVDVKQLGTQIVAVEEDVAELREIVLCGNCHTAIATVECDQCAQANLGSKHCPACDQVVHSDRKSDGEAGETGGKNRESASSAPVLSDATAAAASTTAEVSKTPAASRVNHKRRSLMVREGSLLPVAASSKASESGDSSGLDELARKFESRFVALEQHDAATDINLRDLTSRLEQVELTNKSTARNENDEKRLDALSRALADLSEAFSQQQQSAQGVQDEESLLDKIHAVADDLISRFAIVEETIEGSTKTELRKFERDIMLFLDELKDTSDVNLSETAVGKIHFRCLSCDQKIQSQHGPATIDFSQAVALGDHSMYPKHPIREHNVPTMMVNRGEEMSIEGADGAVYKGRENSTVVINHIYPDRQQQRLGQSSQFTVAYQDKQVGNRNRPRSAATSFRGHGSSRTPVKKKRSAQGRSRPNTSNASMRMKQTNTAAVNQAQVKAKTTTAFLPLTGVTSKLAAQNSGLPSSRNGGQNKNNQYQKPFVDPKRQHKRPGSAVRRN